VVFLKAELLSDLGRMDAAREVDQELKRFVQVRAQSLIREAERFAEEGRTLEAEQTLRVATLNVDRERDQDFRFPKVWCRSRCWLSRPCLTVLANVLPAGWGWHRMSRHGRWTELSYDGLKSPGGVGVRQLRASGVPWTFWRGCWRPRARRRGLPRLRRSATGPRACRQR
jgi:hypothetical protein